MGPYAYRSHATEEQKNVCNQGIRNLVHNLETIAFRAMPPVDLDAARLASFEINLNEHTIDNSGLYTSVALSKNYISVSHTDKDIIYSMLSCLDPEYVKNDEVLTHFVFPEYKVAFPMKSCDVLLFDPTIIHCATNPRNPKALLFSAYTSSNTMHAHISEAVTKLAPCDSSCRRTASFYNKDYKNELRTNGEKNELI